MKKMRNKNKDYLRKWRDDWCLFAEQVLHAKLDEEQKAILRAVQKKKMVAVASGTARGKDYITAVACLCFMYLTPRWNKNKELIKNTKIAMTAPTGRQVTNIMIPEISRLFRNAKILEGRLLADGIRTNNAEWFLTGFKASDDDTESWSGFHAVNTMFAVTEASGISETTFNAIEGNLQGNSRLLLVFNPNVTTGYAAKAMKSSRFKKFRLNSLNAENVVKKRNVIPGQVDYEWVKDKVENWCTLIQKEDFDEGQGDFEFEGLCYRPNDLFRVKVLGLFPKTSEDMLIPLEWCELAVERWRKLQEEKFVSKKHPLIGIDVAGMGRDSSCFVPRYGNYVPEIKIHQSGGKADHMKVAGEATHWLSDAKAKAFIDTIGEGAGVFSRLEELGYKNAYSCKFSEGTKGLHDITGQYEFANMRAYCYWAVRDWLNPKNGFNPALPPCDELVAELTEVHWSFQSSGKIIIEAKEDIKSRLKRSPDIADALASTFYPNAKDYSDDSWILQNVL
nr:MAG TPA: large terminase [Caudoviricetes sp.]